MNFPKIAQQRKKSILAAEMLLQVISRNYAVGDKLPPERVLAQQMDISRNTLREAIAALQLMGLIEVRHSQGNFIIALPEKERTESRLQDIFEPNMNPFDVVDVRMALEPGIAWLAVERITMSELKGLERTLHCLENSLARESLTEYAEADSDFHLCIARGTHNERIVDTLESLLKIRRSPLWSAMKQGLDRKAISRVRLDEHMVIYSAIRDRDQEKALKAMREHLENSMERFLIDVESKFVS